MISSPDRSEKNLPQPLAVSEAPGVTHPGLTPAPDFTPARHLISEGAKPQLVGAPTPAKPNLPSGCDATQVLQSANLWSPGQALKLHLGCGQQRLDGYINIDYPPSEHTVQNSVAADAFANILTLEFADESVDEVRLHHVFEHFDRPTALALLCQWCRWLKAGGRLVIETPDVEASAQLFLDPRVSYVQKQAVLRHLFGSHEAQWAYHYDAWYESKFQRVLSALGFQNIHSERKRWQMTCNITVTATRGQRVPLEQQKGAVTALLSESQVDDSATEQRLCAVWRGKFEQVLMTRGAFAPAPAETGTLAPESDEPVKAPKLSIFMPVYNRERYLAATLDSLLAQTFGDFEIILADDGSTDRSLVIARQYAQRDSRIRVLALPHQGEVAARNAALRQAHPRTQYLMNHDSDDLSMPSKLLKLITHLEAHPETAIVGCLAEYFNDKGQQLGQPPLESQPERIRATFGQTNSMVNSAALIRRSVFEAIGGYREDFRSVDDYDFFARALLAGFNLANVPETLHRIRLHPNSVGSTRAQQQQKLAEQIRLHYRAGQVASPLAVPASKSSVRSKVDKAPLSILHTVEFYAPHIGGAEVVVQQISERLAKRGHRVTVATTHLDDRQFRELNGVTVVGFNVQGKLAEGISGEARPYQQFLREHPADVMMNYAAQQWATDLALEALHDVRDRRVNVIAPCGYSALADERTVRWPRFLHYFQNTLPAALPLYDAAVYHSSIYKDYLFGLHLGLKNGVIIPNGTDEAEFTQPVVVNFREKYGITTRFIGLCVANFYPGKGQERLIHCVRQMNRPDFTMVFIGKEGSQLASLQQQASGLNIRFLAGISRQDTVAAFRTADLFLFGSHIEASPLVIIEAKAARLPFLSTDCGNVREWQGGLVCAPEELAAQANRLLDNETLRKQLAEDGWREWKQKLTWDAVVDQWEDLYLRKHHERLLRHSANRASRGESTGSVSLPQAKSTPTPMPEGPGNERLCGLVFSKDRPLQLEATLNSFFQHAQIPSGFQLRVLYMASKPNLEALYLQLAQDYPQVGFVRQTSFKADVLGLLDQSSYVLFLVDDNLFVRDFALANTIAGLKASPEVLGFSLRLGQNTTYCYPVDRPQALPAFKQAGCDVLQFDWTKAEYDFCYPLEVSSSVYRTADLYALLNELPFTNPNTLEGLLAQQTARFQKTRNCLQCFRESVAFCVPINRVQDVCANRAGTNQGYSAAALAQLFEDGCRMDVAAYSGFRPNACHQEVELKLVNRARSGSCPQPNAQLACPPTPCSNSNRNEPCVCVSVIIPCYKQAHFLAEAVESVLEQTFQHWEIIIVNDGSPDNTSVVAKRLIAKYPDKRIRLIEKPNGGLPSARNAGIRAADGHYILPLDADDRIRPTLLEKLVPILDTQPSVGFAYTHIQHFGACDTEFPLPDFDRATLIAKDNIACVCSLFRKSVWEQVGGYNETMRGGYEDWDFWVGCVEKGWDGSCLHQPLFLYRKSGQSMLSRANQNRERLFAQIVCNHASLYDERTRQWARQILQQHLEIASAQTTGEPHNASSAMNTHSPLRITYLIGSILGVTGGNQTLLRQAEEMRRRGHEVTIVTYTPKPDWFQFQTRVIQVPSGQHMAPFVPQSEVVVATYFSNAPELSSIPAPVKVYYAQGDQYVFEDATLPDTPQNRQRRQLSRASYLLPGIRFVPNSRNLAQAVEKLCGRQPDAILPVCTDQTVFRPLQRPLPRSRFRLLIVGPDARGSEIEPLLFKGIQDIHEALQILAQRSPNFTAIRMSGTPPDIFARFPCEFYVAPSDEMKTMLFGTSHILVYASHYDSCPRPPQEAMAAGCAVVCTATGGALEYCRDGENALLVPIQSPAAIAEAIERLMKEPALREKLVQGGLATARAHPREREWNEWESMLCRFVDEAARKASRPASVPVAPPKPANSTPVPLPLCAKVGNLDNARALLGRQEFAAAWQSAAAALELRPFHPEAWLLLAEIARAAGDAAGARQCAQQARDLAPDWKAPGQFLQKKLKGSKRPDWLALPKPMANRLTVCLITKNEEQFLEKCLKSVKNLAAQIVLVDTGSTDRTLEIAKAHGAEVYSFAWCNDFSAVRNAALEKARGDWVLILDADEELPADQHVKLQSDLQSKKVIGYRLPLVNHGQETEGQSHVPRLFRNAPGVYFHGRVHEQVFPSLLAISKSWGLGTGLGTAQLRHYGYTKEMVQTRNKVERNLSLLRQAIEEDPASPNLVMNLGLELVRSGDAAAGLVHYREAFHLMAGQAKSEIVPELREVLLTQFTCQLYKVRAYAEVVTTLTSPLARNGGLTASLHYALGLAHHELRDHREAAEQMRQCLAKVSEPTLTPINTDILTTAPHHCLALSLAKLGETAGAEQAFHAGLAKQGRVAELKLDYARFLSEHNRPVDALHQLHEIVAENAANAVVWQLGGQIALGRPEFLEFARDWTAEAIKYLPEDAGILTQRAEALLLSQDIPMARELWKGLWERGREPGSLAALVMCELLDGSVTHLPQNEWEAASTAQAWLSWYRKCLTVGASEMVARVNARLEELRRVLPAAAQVLETVLAEVEPPHVAESCVG